MRWQSSAHPDQYSTLPFLGTKGRAAPRLRDQQACSRINFSIYALSMCLADYKAGMQGNGEVALHWVVLSAAPAILAVAPASMLLSLHLLQKSATSGTLLAQYGSDIVAAVVMGLVVMGCCGYTLHMLAMSCRGYLKVRVHPILQAQSDLLLFLLWIVVKVTRAPTAQANALVPAQSHQSGCAVQGVIIGLLLFSACLGAGLSQTTRPYTLQNPKKVYLHHTHHLVEGTGGLGVNHSTWDVVAIDSGSVRQALPKALAPRHELSFRAAEHINLYPVNNFMQVGTAIHDHLQEALLIGS